MATHAPGYAVVGSGMKFTFGSRLAASNGIGEGFNALRLGLALSVMAWHAAAVVSGSTVALRETMLWPFWFALLPMFFALSGFLVVRSALRLPLGDYLLNRGLRIIPGLAVVVVVAAWLIGPMLTTLPLAQYATHPQTWHYLLNSIGITSFHLPGVLADQPFSAINGSLWTIPFEFAYYGVIAIMMALGLLRHPGWMVALVCGYLATAVAIEFTGFRAGIASIDGLLHFAFLSKGASLIPAFMAGSALYLLRDRVPYHPGVLAAVLGGFALAGIFGDPALFGSKLWVAIACWPLAWLAVYLGLAPLRLPAWLAHDDISYGIYLWHFPIMLVLNVLFPMAAGWQVFAAGLLPVFVIASLSWRWVEKPAMRWRRRTSLNVTSPR
jgi:peptidoglycan/LPS O-acetylase OafA/YrhL